MTDGTPRPLGDRVLIKALDDEPEEERPARGIVVAVGPGTMFMRAEEDGPERSYMPVCVDVGDEVLFVADVGLVCEVNGEELLLVGENAILVVMSSIERPVAFDPE